MGQPAAPASPVDTTLLMLVTNRDCVIADFSIASYQRLWKIYKGFRLRIYANCISQANKLRYFRHWARFPYVSLFDNESAGPLRRIKGESFKTPEGIELRYDDNCEHYDEIWTREQLKCETPYFGTVDADFELRSAEFLCLMLDKLRADPRLAACSTEASATVPEYFDSYSGKVMTLNGRWHTWCCIYREEVGKHLNEVSSFCFAKPLPNGGTHLYDSYANFQALLIEKYGYRLEALGPAHMHQHIHYGAFSKNKSIGRWKIWPYRWLAIAAGPGLMCSNSAFAKRINRIAAKWGRALFDRYFAQAVKERSVYDF
jgi:hypothetical protein